MSSLDAQAALAGTRLEVVGAAYRADAAFPQYMHLWSEGWALKNKAGEPQPYARADMPLGAYVQVYVRNGTTSPVQITGLKLEGIELEEALPFREPKAANLQPASLHFSTLPKSDKERLLAAGEPIWWKADPPRVAPGGFAEITLRLRRASSTGAVNAEIGGFLEEGGEASPVRGSPAFTPARVPVSEGPRFAAIHFSPQLDRVFCYLRHSDPSAPAPVKVLLDGRDVTARTTMAADQAVDIAPLLILPERPLVKGSFHCLQAVHGDGSTAIAGVRAWGDELVYGMWGYINQGETPAERVDYFLGDLQRHNVNAVMESYGGEVADYLSGENGREHSKATGIRAMRREPGKVLDPLYYFLLDEPDAHDFAVKQLEPGQRLGALGQALVRRSRRFRERDPAVPQLLNVDNTYKPENWYMYAQLADVYCADPYFQEQQRLAWNERPAWAASFIKPLYVLGAATVCRWACAPKPLHLILNAVRHDTKDAGFRFATPAEKTVELFYALGAGATGFSFWWYTPYGEFHGCGSSDAAAVALWRQIGLLGAQVRAAGPILTRSCPATVPLRAPAKLWTRVLLAGADTLVLLAVNENIASDRLGTVVAPLPQATVALTLPNWLKAADVFELAPEGLRQASWKGGAGQAVLELGRTEVARMLLITADQNLRARLEELYRREYQAKVERLISAR